MKNNFVAKHMAKVNKPSVEVDKKKEENKTGAYLGESLSLLMAKEGAGVWVDPTGNLYTPTDGSVWTVDIESEEL